MYVWKLFYFFKMLFDYLKSKDLCKCSLFVSWCWLVIDHIELFSELLLSKCSALSCLWVREDSVCQI